VSIRAQVGSDRSFCLTIILRIGAEVRVNSFSIVVP
jgi:hypothetical protein